MLFDSVISSLRMYSYMMRLCASLSGNVCHTILMKKMFPSLLLRPAGMDVLMSRARSDVMQFLIFVFRECSIYSCENSFTRCHND
jgi:hypothetical protein